MNSAQIEANLSKLVKNFTKVNFVYNLLAAYGIPKATVTRLKKGSLNLSKIQGEVLWKKKLYFKEVDNDNLPSVMETIKDDARAMRHDPRFIIVTNYEGLLAYDTKTKESLDIPILELAKNYDFFLPWAGMEKAQHQSENPADVKAAEKMAKLYDEIKKDNPTTNPDEVHSLNIFLSRLLFCFFAEDTGIFKSNQFSHSIISNTQTDGSDLDVHLNKLFEVLNTHPSKRTKLSNILDAFPYVNGGLFKDNYRAPKFTVKSRNAIVEIGGLDWSAINPDIFGSMMQAVVTPEHREGLGMHYTSVPNIMKVIRPLFLDDLNEEFEKGKNNPAKLNKLLDRISNLKIFDPACGSGNFLIIAYKELRMLEIEILKQLQKLQHVALTGFEDRQYELLPKAQQTLAASFKMSLFSRIELDHFYGIELDDFAHEVAILSLWLAEHQMNMKFNEIFSTTNPSLPLKDGGHIIHGNATRLKWEKVCPKKESDEIYILGNPPYLGSRVQNDSHKEDMKFVFKTNYKSLDYIATWFFKGAKFIKGINAKCAFVSTNSISQGEQVSLIWERVLNNEIEIGFAHKDFKWNNSAKANAAVIVVIIGIQNISNAKKYFYNESIKKEVSTISPYLVESKTVYIYSRQTPLSNLPEMNFGNMPADGGKLLFTTDEMDKFILSEPNSKPCFKKLISAREFLNGQDRWCLWLEYITQDELYSMPQVLKRVEELKEIRENSSRPQLAEIPHLFAQITQPSDQDFILIPRHSSENREYIPIGFFNGENKAHDSCLIVPTNETYLFGVLTSLIHVVWVKFVCGRIKSDYRYSKDVVYNNFPFPSITHLQKEMLEGYVYEVLAEREKHPEKTLAQLYDPDKMPDGLRSAHHQLDLAVERCYRQKPFESDEERLAYLFNLYETMIREEQSSNFELVFETPVSTKKKK